MLAAIAATVAVVVMITTAAARHAGAVGVVRLGGAVVDTAALPETIPMRRLDGRYVVDVVVGDVPSAVALLVDTGSPTMLLRTLANQAGAVHVSAVETRSPDGRRASHPVVSLPSLRLGSVRFTSVKAIAAPSRSIPMWIDSGILGANVMSAAAWQFDFRSRRLGIAPTTESLDHIDGAVRLPFRPHSSSSPSPVVELGVGGRRVSFLVDTGFDGGLALHPADLAGADQITLRAGRTQTTDPARLAGAMDHPVDSVIAAVTVRDLPPRPYVIEASERLTAGLGLMGVGFFSDKVLTIDWASNALYLDPQPRQPARPGH
jgi:predicted aspartyl protease